MEKELETYLNELMSALEAYRAQNPDDYASTEQEIVTHLEAIAKILEGAQ